MLLFDKNQIKTMTYINLNLLCNKLCKPIPVCEFCMDGLGVSRIWTGQGTFWMACVQTFDNSDIFESRDRQEYN